MAVLAGRAESFDSILFCGYIAIKFSFFFSFIIFLLIMLILQFKYFQ